MSFQIRNAFFKHKVHKEIVKLIHMIQQFDQIFWRYMIALYAEQI